MIPGDNSKMIQKEKKTKVKEEWKPLISRVYDDPDKILSATLITMGGSNRAYYRLQAENFSFILLEDKNRKELEDYVLINSFYESNGVPVPKILAGSVDENRIIVQDVGNDSLYSTVHRMLREEKREEKNEEKNEEKKEEIIKLYERVIKKLIKIQKIPRSRTPDFIIKRRFDFRHYRWETDYFREKCCGDYFNIPAIKDTKLTDELDKLAHSLENEPEVIVHRDFQSQNIFIQNGQIYFLDFQSARMGSAFYDVASLLKDPYVELPGELQDELFLFYLDEQKKNSIYPNLSGDLACDIYNRVALQRLMQALGAYGKLGLTDGKTHFLQYVSPAVVQLNNTLRQVGNFECLKKHGENMFVQLT
jgi:N-acetylmuramate 1-kinase